MSFDPYGPPFAGPVRPARRGWPTPVLVLVGVASGVLLMAAPFAGGIALVAADHGSHHSAAGPTGPPAPDPSSSPDDSPSDSPSSPSDAGPLTIEFPDGARGTFTAPTGLQHDADEDDHGHVALSSDGDNPPYLDVYADRTTASARRNLAAAVADERAEARRKGGGSVGSASTFTYAGQPVAQFRIHRPETDDHSEYDALVTVTLVKGDVVTLYWIDATDDFDQVSANADELAVVRSMDVVGGADPTT